MTIDDLRAFGANVDEGLERCMNNEEFYLRLVNKVIAGSDFEDMKAAYDGGDIKTAFAKAHDLKGVLGNLALSPLFEPVSELTELFRSGEPVSDDGGLFAVVFARLEQIRTLAD